MAASVIQGTVVDAETRKPLPAVNIYIQETSLGATTNAKGAFSLRLPDLPDSTVFAFEHIGYQSRSISYAQLQTKSRIELIPKVVQAPEVRVESTRESMQLGRDLPQSFTILSGETFQARGYIDAGDLLKTEESIQINEEFSGEKTVSIRGGNADDVLVLYNGIKLNNSYDNTFDVSLLNLDDVQQVEVVRGSHTSLYGAEGMSGVINVVPLTQPEYWVRFQQRFGTYNSGVWDAQLHYNIADKLDLSYSQKRGGAQRFYSPNYDSEFLQNDVVHHSGHLGYEFGKSGDGGSIDLLVLHTTTEYDNNKNFESLQNVNELLGASFNGHVGPIRHLRLIGAVQQFNRNQFVWLEPDYVDRQADNRSYQFTVDKHWFAGDFEVLAGYQWESASLDFLDKRRMSQDIPIGIEGALAEQQRHGFVMIVKYHAPTASETLHTMDFDFSARYDRVINDIQETAERQSVDFEMGPSPLDPETIEWNRPTIKFSTNLEALLGTVSFQGYVNNSINVKFPSLFQQLSTPLSLSPDADYIHPNLNPEQSSSMEIGLNLGRQMPWSNVNAWLLQFNVFRTSYVNKFRMYYLNGIPMAFYDNVNTAKISGFEISGTLYALQNALSAQLGLVLYDVSAKSAFPFKSDQKLVCNLGYQAHGWSLQVHGFMESDQVGWVRDEHGRFMEIELPGFANMDVHAGKSFPVGRVRGNINFSARNLINDETLVEGLALRDSRIYVTFGVQY